MHRRICIHLAAMAAAVTLAAGMARPAQAQVNLQAFPQDGGSVYVTWQSDPNPAITGYNVYRRDSTLTADKATLVNAQPITSTFLVDAGADGKGLPLGKTQTYFVRGVSKDASGKPVELNRSTEAIATPQNAIKLAAGNFLAYDMDTFNPGTMTMNGNVLTVQASGVPLWDISDGQTFIATPVAGDYQLTARVEANPTNTDDSISHDYAKAGIEIRSSLVHRSWYQAVFTSVNRDPEILTEGRAAGDGVYTQPFSTGSATGQADTKYPLWLRLLKKGTAITAFQSFDGKAFDQVGDPKDFGNLPSVTYAGLFVSADHSPDSDKAFTVGKFDVTQITIQPQ
jgi:hypothetical protein